MTPPTVMWLLSLLLLHRRPPAARAWVIRGRARSPSHSLPSPATVRCFFLSRATFREPQGKGSECPIALVRVFIRHAGEWTPFCIPAVALIPRPPIYAVFPPSPLPVTAPAPGQYEVKLPWGRQSSDEGGGPPLPSAVFRSGASRLLPMAPPTGVFFVVAVCAVWCWPRRHALMSSFYSAPSRGGTGARQLRIGHFFGVAEVCQPEARLHFSGRLTCRCA